MRLMWRLALVGLAVHEIETAAPPARVFEALVNEVHEGRDPAP